MDHTSSHAEPVGSVHASSEIPRGGLRSLLRYGRYDLISGFLVFLIALPLCLGISMASGYPPIAGIFTAIIGGVIGTLVSNSELTIKGPAAGLIVIAFGAVQELGHGDPILGYQRALGIGVVAGLLQICFGLLRAGALSEFFPSAAVHGMLAAIGIIITSKQVHTILGVAPTAKDPLGLLAEIPHSLANLNPEVALIGGLSLLLLFGLPLIKNRYVRMVPAPMLVVVLSIPLGRYFDLSHQHLYSWHHHIYSVGAQYLVKVPDHLLQAVVGPNFSAVLSGPGLKYVAMFALVGSLESLLSAKATDLLDPWQRKTHMNRDLLAVGIGNTLASFVGGLPMISEIVRSSANINNGARTRAANLFHGLLLLGFVALVPGLIRQIPLAALAAMLVYTGSRLASPKEFVAAYQVGREQLLIFTTTVVMTLLTDLLVGIGAGVAVKALVHLVRGVPVMALFRSQLTVEEVKPTQSHPELRVRIQGAAVFTNWLGLSQRLRLLLAKHHGETVVLDFTDAKLVDHTVMSKLSELRREVSALQGIVLSIIGLGGHEANSAHPLAARVKPAEPAQRQ